VDPDSESSSRWAKDIPKSKCEEDSSQKCKNQDTLQKWKNEDNHLFYLFPVIWVSSLELELLFLSQ
jgi:hypothetical protein